MVYLLFKYIACLIHFQHTCLYWKVYIVSENNNVVSLNEVNCSSAILKSRSKKVILKSRNKKWDRIATETNSVLMGTGFTYTD